MCALEQLQQRDAQEVGAHSIPHFLRHGGHLPQWLPQSGVMPLGKDAWTMMHEASMQGMQPGSQAFWAGQAAAAESCPTSMHLQSTESKSTSSMHLP